MIYFKILFLLKTVLSLNQSPSCGPLEQRAAFRKQPIRTGDKGQRGGNIVGFQGAVVIFRFDRCHVSEKPSFRRF